MMKKFIFALFSICISVTAIAQTGTLKGKITDKKTREPIIGATVTILGTYAATSTN
jgi:VIT1/CCC1 family predicted Fe2+/Mn2+ transporter